MHVKSHPWGAQRRATMVLACGLTLLAVSACGSSSKSRSHSGATQSAAPSSSSTSTGTSSTTTSGTGTTPADTTTGATTTTSTGTVTASGTGTVTRTGAGTTTGAGSASSTADVAYAHAVVTLATTFQKAATAFEKANGPGTPAALATSSKAFSTAADRFADQLGKLTPPTNVASAQKLLVSVVHTFGHDLAKLSKDAADDNISAMKAETAAIQKLEPKLQAAENAIQK